MNEDYGIGNEAARQLSEVNAKKENASTLTNKNQEEIHDDDNDV